MSDIEIRLDVGPIERADTVALLCVYASVLVGTRMTVKV